MYSGKMRITSPVSNGHLRTISGKFTRNTQKVISFDEQGNKVIHSGASVRHITVSGSTKEGMFNGKKVRYVTGLQNTGVVRD